MSLRFGERHQVNNLGLLVWEELVESFTYTAGYLGGVLVIVRDFICNVDYKVLSYFKIVLSVWTEFFFIFNNFLIILNLVSNLFSELFI